MIPNYEFLKARIKGCQTTEDVYKVFDEISDYLIKYNVSEIMYRKIFDLCMAKYNEVK